MSCKVKYIKLKRSDNYGFGFSVLGGAGSELPPLVYDVIEGSPASNSNQLSPGDIILEINGQEVLNFTTKEVLNCLRLSTREVILKLKSDTALKEKVHHLRQTPNNSEILRNAITQDDLQGVKEIVAKKSEAKNEDALKSLSPKKDLPKESTSISSLSSSSSSEHNDKVESNKYTVCQQEKTNKIAGPEKIKKKKHSSHRKPSSQDKEAAVNGDPDRTPTNTPPQTPGSGTLSPETLAYQQLWESEDEITCLSEKSDESSSCASANKRPTSATSPPLSEDESDIESLHSFHYSPKAVDIPSAVRLAKRLFALDGFKKSDVSRHLSKNNEFSKAVAEEYLRYFNFSKDTLDIALRKFLDKFCLSGETQERERVLVHFSKRYLDCNPGQFNSQDAVHTLTCALMLLNTDLHNQNIGRKMTCSEFIDNLAELNDGENFQPEILRALYYAIKSEPLKWAADDGDESSKVAGQGLLEEAHRVIGSNPFLSTPIGSGVIYKKGYIMRKCCVEPSGKRTAFGKRSWKMWFCVIQDLVLYLHKDEQGARRGPPPQMGQNAVRLHHALAQKALDYSKKEHVFRLQTADQAEYLLQTSDSKELQAWIDAINFVAASLSAPPMPGAVGSQKKFQRPLLPCSITKLNVVEQLEDHSARVNQIESELNDLKTNPLDKNAKSATVSSHKEKLAYLTSELRRYQTYVHLLRSRLESSSGVSKVMVGGVVNPLPVFDGVEVKEVGPEEAGDPSSGGGIVPPPIPERSTRHADSDDGENFQDRGMQTSDGSNKFLGRNKKDEFQKELEKMIKEKEKKDKKREKIEKKEQADTLKRKTREQKNMTNENHKDNDNKDNKDNDNKNEENRKEIECQEDPRMGTFARVSALFKFSKLNRPNQRRTLYNEEGTEKLDNDQSLKDNSKPDNDIASFPPSKVDNDIATFPSEHIENKTYPTPPPLPPKPGPNSPIMKNLGTRVINV
ncbi:UNVERIFIED_CONTAM: hypothetical protein RMT77_011430 [Armadillidium vulgare]